MTGGHQQRRLAVGVEVVDVESEAAEGSNENPDGHVVADIGAVDQWCITCAQVHVQQK